jgi:hypothetical protein
LNHVVVLAFTTGNAACTESSTLCRELDPKISAQGRFAESNRSSSRHRKNPTVCAEREQSSLSAQPTTHGTEELWRELQKQALGTSETSWHNGTALTAVGPAVKCAESPPLALGTKFCAECLIKALGKELKENQIHTFKPFYSSTYTPTKSICFNFT